jgi:hypothetical protein
MSGPIYLPTYNLGDEGKPNHFNAATTREVAADEAKSLTVGDAAFIRRSDRKWTYAVVTEKVEGESSVLKFEVDTSNHKIFPETQWGKYIRVIHVDEDELIRLKVEAGVEDMINEEEIMETSGDIVQKDDHGDSVEAGSDGKEESTNKHDQDAHEDDDDVDGEEGVKKDQDAHEDDDDVDGEEGVKKEVVEAEPNQDALAAASRSILSMFRLDTFIPSIQNKTESSVKDEKDEESPLAPTSPAISSAVNNDDDDHVNTRSPPSSPRVDLQWGELEAFEVDYEVAPTDLFQAIEAKQYEYAELMYNEANIHFTKDCKTWVVTRGQKEDQLRFRALPLHAALVFGAPDDLVMKIYNSYPLAARGRDVRGRLPIHLAMEHNASSTIVSMLIEAFPKGIFATDKKDMTPLDYIDDSTNDVARVQMKKEITLIIAAKVEDERAKYEIALAEALEAQREALTSSNANITDTESSKPTSEEPVRGDLENVRVSMQNVLGLSKKMSPKTPKGEVSPKKVVSSGGIEKTSALVRNPSPHSTKSKGSVLGSVMQKFKSNGQ